MKKQIVKSKEPKEKVSKTPTTMEELLVATGYKLKGYRRGEVVTGKVSEIAGRTILVNVGGKSDAVVADVDYETAKDYLMTLKVGDEVKGIVLTPENDAGQIVLSVRRAAADSKWKSLEKAMEEETEVTAMGKEMTRGGLLADVEGVYGFIPASQFSKAVAENPESLIDKAIKVKVIEVDREQSRLVLSEKAVSEAEEIEARKKALAKVKVGGEHKGTIVGLVPFGAFVEIKAGKDTLEGLVHISEISWEKVDDVSKVFTQGEKIDVQVIGVDEDTGKLALSAKRLKDDPWKDIEKRFPVESKHGGKVVKIAAYGVFVNLEKGIEGLIHASKMPAEVSFVEGQEVEVFVESIDLDKRRLSLGVVTKDTKGMIYK